MAFWKLYYHIVWPTKNREHLVQPGIERRLYPYLVNKAAELGVFVYAINGWYDHIHLVVSIPPKLPVADVVKRLKGASSHDLNHGETRDLDRPFAWQRGYGVLSIGERQRSTAEAYVANQKQHHTAHTTNGWLERDDELDEGPSDTGSLPDRFPRSCTKPGSHMRSGANRHSRAHLAPDQTKDKGFGNRHRMDPTPDTERKPVETVSVKSEHVSMCFSVTRL